MRYDDIRGQAERHFVRGIDLGRYEFRQGTSQKFYHVIQDTQGKFWAFYGRLGAQNPQKVAFRDAMHAAETLEEKRRKGYQWVPGYASLELQWIRARGARLDAVLPPAPSQPTPLDAPSSPPRRPRL